MRGLRGRSGGVTLAALPIVLGLLGTIELVVLDPTPLLPALACEWIAASALVYRRRAPLVACTTAAVVVGFLPAFGVELNEPAAPVAFLVVAAYGLGRHLADLRGLIGIAASVVNVFAVGRVWGNNPTDVTNLVFVSVLALSPWVVGRIVRSLSASNRALADEALQLTADRDRAVAEERTRIARELHDVIAHSISVMVVQAAAAQDMVMSRPEHAVASLEQVQAVGRRALAETGRLLHLIRDDSEDDVALTPTLGAADVDGLVAGLASSGMPVGLSVDGSIADLPVGIDVSVYRIVQEALTNVLKHARGAATSVRLIRGVQAMQVEVENTRPAGEVRTTTLARNGLGLIGVRERITIFGGTLEARPTESGGFVLRARLPLTAGDT